MGGRRYVHLAWCWQLSQLHQRPDGHVSARGSVASTHDVMCYLVLDERERDVVLAPADLDPALSDVAEDSVKVSSEL